MLRILLDFCSLAFLEQTVVDEETGELVADGCVHECCLQRNNAPESAQMTQSTDLLADLCGR